MRAPQPGRMELPPGHIEEVTLSVHEVADVIDALGAGVSAESWSAVGVGWHGGYCFTCDSCRAGDFTNCVNALLRTAGTLSRII
jgi:D-arabinose 1-dehydrogenase-like Zn-dependent alcohol dehydrogenase